MLVGYSYIYWWDIVRSFGGLYVHVLVGCRYMYLLAIVTCIGGL